MKKIELGEYVVTEDLANGVFEATRHGEPWRDLVGDNLVYMLVEKIDEEFCAVKGLEKQLFDSIQDKEDLEKKNKFLENRLHDLLIRLSI